MKNKYDYVSVFKNGFAKVYLNGKWGFIDETDNEVVEIKYDWIFSINSGYFKHFSVNNQMESILETVNYDIFDKIKNDGFFKVILNNERYWINKDSIKIKEIELL